MATERKHPALYGQGGSEQPSLWMALPIRAEYSLEERWVDETRDFLSSSSSTSSSSSASPSLSLSLPPYVSEFSCGCFSHKHLYKPLARQGVLSGQKWKSPLQTLFCSAELIRIQAGEELCFILKCMMWLVVSVYSMNSLLLKGKNETPSLVSTPFLWRFAVFLCFFFF